MTVLVDTSVLIDHLRGHPPAVAALRELVRSGRPRVASVLTRTEILRGLPARQRTVWQGLAGILTWLPVDVAIADRAGELAATYRRSHGSIDLVDHLLAATAEHHGAELWTRNVRRFPSLSGLRPPYDDPAG
ncbi:MAG TPA: type II toxin-antitoxin system VapC family toxin [Mycobacteriales bacterium]|nr:type II toxin-antitoxin system VapC family toxin [Mycobacteriales bacterium]